MYSDNELIEMIRQGGVVNEKAWHFIIKQWKAKLFYRLKMIGATDDDCLDMLNEVYEPVVKRIKNTDLEEIENLAAFISTSLVYKWYKVKPKSSDFSSLDLDEITKGLIDEEQELVDEDDIKYLQNVLEKLNKNCAQVLYMWAEGFNMTEIAQRLQYKSAEAMKKKKYKCLEQAKELSRKLKNIAND